MTAQQQLAELMSMKLGDRGAFWCDSATCFIRDYGPAIAELVTAATVLERWRVHWSKLRFDLGEQVRAELAAADFRKALVSLTAAQWIESPTDQWLEQEQRYWRPLLPVSERTNPTEPK